MKKKILLAIPLAILGLVVGSIASGAPPVEPPTAAATDLQCQGKMYFKGSLLLTQEQLAERTFASVEAAASTFLASYQRVGRADGKPVTDGQSMAVAMRPTGVVFGLVSDGRLDFAAEVP